MGQLDGGKQDFPGGLLALPTHGWGLLTRRARQPVDGELSGRSSQRRPRLARAKGRCLCAVCW